VRRFNHEKRRTIKQLEGRTPKIIVPGKIIKFGWVNFLKITIVKIQIQLLGFGFL
jgi:hypothetical protein